MRLEIEIPKEFENDFISNKFKNFFSRVIADIDYLGCCGNYEREIAEMFIKSFTKSKQAYDMDKVISELRRRSGNGYRDVDGDYVPPMIATEKAIEIVQQGRVADDICEWKRNDTFRGMQTYKAGCCDKILDLTVKTALNMHQCPYCKKKIRAVE